MKTTNFSMLQIKLEKVFEELLQHFHVHLQLALILFLTNTIKNYIAHYLLQT